MRVVVSPTERAKIEASAEAASMTVSAFLRALGMGYSPASKVDKSLVVDLVHIAGDQGRLGGLLKQWLSERPGEGASEHEVATLLRQLLETQARIKERVLRL